jgi:hypothetical protein
MFQEACTPLYEGCLASHLTAILLLLNLMTTHGVSKTFVDEFFALLKIDLFPKANTMPKSMYHAKRLIQRLGLSYKAIHNGCVLFKGELNDATSCPKCKKSCYIEGSYHVPCKVLWHFPLIPRLRRIYMCFSLAKLMTWHGVNKSGDGMVCSICDSKAWKHVDNTHYEKIMSIAISLYSCNLVISDILLL